MSGIADKHFLFEVKLNWLANKTGILLSNETTGTIQVATPPQFLVRGYGSRFANWIFCRLYDLFIGRKNHITPF